MMNIIHKLAETVQKHGLLMQKIDDLRAERDALLRRLSEAESERRTGAMSISEYHVFRNTLLGNSTSEEMVNSYNARMFDLEKQADREEQGIILLKKLDTQCGQDKERAEQHMRQNTILNIAFLVLLIMTSLFFFAGMRLQNPSGMAVSEGPAAGVPPPPFPPSPDSSLWEDNNSGGSVNSRGIDTLNPPEPQKPQLQAAW